MGHIAHTPIRSAMLAKVTAVVPQATILQDNVPTALENLPPGTISVDLFCSAIEYQESEEFGAVHQQEKWTWRVEILIAGQAPSDSQDIWDGIVLSLLDAFCPAEGWRPAQECDVVNAVEARFEGISALGRFYSLTLSHGRYQ